MSYPGDEADAREFTKERQMTGRDVFNAIKDWVVNESKMHPTIAAGIAGFFLGWMAPKIILLVAKLFA